METVLGTGGKPCTVQELINILMRMPLHMLVEIQSERQGNMYWVGIVGARTIERDPTDARWGTPSELVVELLEER